MTLIIRVYIRYMYHSTTYLLDERLRFRLPLSAPFFALDFPWSVLVLALPLLDFTGLRPRELKVRFLSLSLSLSLRAVGDRERDRERLLRPLKERENWTKSVKKYSHKGTKEKYICLEGLNYIEMFNQTRMAKDFGRIYLHPVNRSANHQQDGRKLAFTSTQSFVLLTRPSWRTEWVQQTLRKFKSSTYKWLSWRDSFGQYVSYVPICCLC